jgi:predicted lipid-binding transport protein (Tim44 family)
MKTYLRSTSLLALLACFALALGGPLAEARIGGGRSGGFRGSRGFGGGGASRSYAPRPNPNPGYGQRPAPAPAPYSAPYNPGGGSFMRGLMGGVAGGFLGSMLFRGVGNAGYGAGGGGGGIGLLEILVFAALGFWAFRAFGARRRQMAGYDAGGMSAYDKLRSVEPGPFAGGNGPSLGTAGAYVDDATAATDDDPSEAAQAAKLAQLDRTFDLDRFKDDRMDDFLKLQKAWNFRDLSSVERLVAPEIRAQLDADIADLRRRRRINRIENVAVRGTELTEAWQERGQEYATLRFRANVTDTTLDESTLEVLEGDPNEPVKFEESWTFVRRADGSSAGNPWKLTAIES